MWTYDIVSALHRIISEFIEGDGGMDFAPYYYKLQLDSRYEQATKSITNDINDDIERLTKEDCAQFKEDFERLKPEVVANINSLLERIENIGIDSSQGVKAKMQLEFCEKIKTFISEVLKKIEEERETALTQAQIEEMCYLCPNGDYLEMVYWNLRDKHWICGKHTSIYDFIYYFTGEGFKPSEPIHWNVSAKKLTLFLNEMVEDDKIWSKASFMFLVKNKPVGKKVLGNTFSKCMKRKQEEECETDSRKRTIEKLEREIRWVIKGEEQYGRNNIFDR